MLPEEKGGAFMVAKGPHIILESTAGCRVRWIALPLLPVGLLGARGARSRQLAGTSGWGGGRIRATLMSSCMKHESSRRHPCSGSSLNTIDALILNCSTIYVCGYVCSRAPSSAKLASTNSLPSQHQACATNQGPFHSTGW